MNPLLFIDPAFLFCFAPVVLTLYYLLPRSWRNAYLLASSVLLYAWGEGKNLGVLLASIVINFVCGWWIGRRAESSRRVLIVGISANLLLLGMFKYPAFVVTNVDVVIRLLGFAVLPVPRVTLPIGLSFFTFMAISYLVDVYRGETEAEKNPVTFGLYIALFPHLVAGPIVRFTDIASQLHNRTASMEEVAQGARRFVIGLGKKILIGNTVSKTADGIFALPLDQLSTPLAWLGALCYSVQIYFDFSGYTDMAIGIARMLGFQFPENFNYPYISQSITEFWRRWHMSLTTWLRDYLFFPLGVRGGNWKLYRNTLSVFLLCGLWHGAAWRFVLWGLLHGVFVMLERMGLRERLEKTPAAVRHGYTLLVVMIGWVLFRSETIPKALGYLSAMSGLGHATLADFQLQRYLPADVVLALVAGIVGSAPGVWRPRWSSTLIIAPAAEFAALAGVFLLSLAIASAGTYNAFIYFRF